MPDMPWWDARRHADRRPLLLERNRIQSKLRLWLADEGFTEVDPAALQRSPGNETHLHAFGTDAIGNDGVATRMYLHTSPEFAMKKLLAAGKPVSPPSPMSGATANADRSIRRNSRCWNGIASGRITPC